MNKNKPALGQGVRKLTLTDQAPDCDIYINKPIYNLKEIVANKKVIDIGCGFGRNKSLVELAGGEWTGVEPFEGGANTVVGDAENLPFDDAIFDVAIMDAVLEHIPDVGKAISEVARVLKPGGVFIGYVAFMECFHEISYSHLSFKALEHYSTINGMKLEKIVRDAGAIPATIAILDGIPKVGLTNDELRRISSLSTVPHEANAPLSMRDYISKASRRDVAFMISGGRNASTTVSATMLFAAQAGIRVFATGGIGGVHRAQDGLLSIDISADLTELGRTPVAVVCSGVKSILDIPSTLEVLETQGVPVMTYRSNEFPAFFTASSGCPSPYRFDDCEDIARMLHAGDKFCLQQGIVVAVPNPLPIVDSVELNQCIDHALQSAKRENIKGSAITPYLLAAVNKLTKGESLEANKRLVFNNAKIAAEISVIYSSRYQQNRKYMDIFCGTLHLK